MKKRNKDWIDWKVETIITFVIIALTAVWIVVFGKDAQAGGYLGTYHLAPTAEDIVKDDGLVVKRVLDGQVRCYIVITEARMIGFQSSISCVIPEKEEIEIHVRPPESREGR